MIFFGFSFVFATINCGLIDYGPIVEMDSDNLTTGNTTQITLETVAMETDTQSNTILLLSTWPMAKPLMLSFNGNEKLSRNDFYFNIQEMLTTI